MKTKSKALLLTLCAVLLVAASVLGTMAYLTDSDKVENTFTVGKVDISLDEAEVNADGKAIDKDGKEVTDLAAAKRVTKNSYKLMPGHSYVKDPTIHVDASSEDCYIVAKVTLTNADKWVGIAQKYAGGDLTKIITGFNENLWYVSYSPVDEATKNMTITFVYKNETKDESLKRVWQSGKDGNDLVLFKEIVIPGGLNNTELDSIKDTTITVNAYAIQAEGFTSYEQAWAATFGAPVVTPEPTT